MRQTELHLTDGDRLVVDEIRSKGVHQSREVNRAHVLSSLDRGVPEAQIMAVLGMGRTAVWRTCKVVSIWRSSTSRALAGLASTAPTTKRE